MKNLTLVSSKNVYVGGYNVKKKIIIICSFIILIAVFIVTYKYKTLWDSTKLTTSEGAIFIKYSISSVELDNSSDLFEYYTEVDTNGVYTERATKNIRIPGKEMPSVSRQLSNDEITKLYEMIYDNNLLHMKNDISTASCDGSYVYLTFYLEDGSEYTVGGLNPNNIKFDAVINYLTSLYTPEMDDELTEKTKAYDNELNPVFLYNSFYSEIKTYGLDVTEAQLDTRRILCQ